jgi:hypothetical protein
MIQKKFFRGAVAMCAIIVLLIAGSTRLQATTGSCGGASAMIPFTDVPSSNAFFCSIASAFFSGLTNGATATTYSPSATVSREQMAAFVSRTLDQSIMRNNRRAAMQKFWVARGPADFASVNVGNSPNSVRTDGDNLYVANRISSTVKRISSQTFVETGEWTGIAAAEDLVIARSSIFVLGQQGHIYQLSPAAPGAVNPIIDLDGTVFRGIVYDGSRLWVTSSTADTVTAISLNPATSQSFTGFTDPVGLVYDGSHIWVAESSGKIKKLDINTGAVLQTITLPNSPGGANHPCFDGTNIWVPAGGDKIYVVRVKDTAGNPLPDSGPSAAFVLAQLTGNGLDAPTRIAFDGARMLAVNSVGGGLSLWKAADLTPIASIPTDNAVQGVCSDGLDFWFVESTGPSTPGRLLRF